MKAKALRRAAAGLPLARSWSPECTPAPCVSQEEEAEAERLASIVPLTADEVKEFDATTFSYRKKVLTRTRTRALALALALT